MRILPRNLIPVCAVLVLCLLAIHGAAADPTAPQAAEPAGTVDNATWAIEMPEYFPNAADGPEWFHPTKHQFFVVYASRREGTWVAAVGSSRNSFSANYHPVDISGVAVENGKFHGSLKHTISPDPWAPGDHRVHTAVVELDGTLGPKSPESKNAKEIARITGGTWKATFDGKLKREGTLGGGVGATEVKDEGPYTYSIVFDNVLPGGTPKDQERRLAINFGIQDNKVTTLQTGPVSMRSNRPYSMQLTELVGEFRPSLDGISGKTSVQATDLDGNPITVNLTFTIGRTQGLLAGPYEGTVVDAEGKETKIAAGAYGWYSKGAASPRPADPRPWFVPTRDWKPVAAGEHPRLLFRASDVPELQRRAKTPEGQQIIGRLKELLGGGEEMPKVMNPATKAYQGGFKYQAGAYSISHAAGFGFLYQLTGEKKYADLARQCVELAWKGQRDFDDRYAWVSPGGQLRAGPSLGWYAVAYDLGYSGWDDAFRRKFALAIQNYDAGEGEKTGNSLRQLCVAPRQPPTSNHYGAVTGGAGLAVLAIKGDPGTDKDLLARYDEAVQKQVVRAFEWGFGDKGFFGGEGHGPGQIFTDTAFVPYLQALRTAAGRDYINGPRTNVRYITLLRVMELAGPPAQFPYRSNMPGNYGNGDFFSNRHGLSRGGQIVQGFGTIADSDKPALLWTYNHVVEPDAAKRDFDLVTQYPHRAMLALINWPMGLAEKNPGAILPKAIQDKPFDYFVFRKGWQDKDDPLVTVQLHSPGLPPYAIAAWGLGNRLRLPQPAGNPANVGLGNDGSGWVVTDAENPGLLVVDYSSASGADALILSGPADEPKDFKPANERARLTTLKVTKGSTLPAGNYHVVTFSASGQHPEPRHEGATVVVGGQKITLDPKTRKIALSTFTPEK